MEQKIKALRDFNKDLRVYADYGGESWRDLMDDWDNMLEEMIGDLDRDSEGKLTRFGSIELNFYYFYLKVLTFLASLKDRNFPKLR